MGLDSSGPERCGRFSGPADTGKPISYPPSLVAARQSLLEVLRKSRDAALSIDKASERLQCLADGLPALEAAVRPLYSQSLQVTELGVKIDQALAPAEPILKTFEIVHSLETAIKDDPRGDILIYLAALTKLEEAVNYLSLNFNVALKCIADAKDFLATSKTADKYTIYRLSERLASVQQDIKSEGCWDMGLLNIAYEKLELAFKRLLTENSISSVSLPSAVDHPPLKSSSPPPLPLLLPASVTSQLQAIAERLNAHQRVDSILDTYRNLRLASIQSTLQRLEPDYLRYSTSDEVDKVEWTQLEGMIGLWTQHIEVACTILFKSERRLCSRVFEKIEKEKWIKCWGKLVMGGFVPFLAFGEGVVKSQTAPEKLFKLLDMYDAMDNLLPYVFEVFEGTDAGCGEIRLRSRGLLKRIALRASETIWDFGQFVEDGRGDVPPDGGRSRLCSYVVNYIKYLVSEFYGPIMAKVVRIDQSWQDKKGPNEDNEDRWLSLVVTHMMHSLGKHVIRQAKSYEDPSLASIYLLNNFWYMITRAKASEIGPLLGETWMKDSRRKVQQQTLEYQRETWGKTLSYLSRDGLSVSSGGKGGPRELARQRLKNFTLSFEENCHKHSKWVVPEEDLKQGIRLAVTQAVVPAYRSYIQNYKGLLEQGSHTARYVKFSPEEVETMLGDLFEVRSKDSRPRNDFTEARGRSAATRRNECYGNESERRAKNYGSLVLHPINVSV